MSSVTGISVDVLVLRHAPGSTGGSRSRLTNLRSRGQQAQLVGEGDAERSGHRAQEAIVLQGLGLQTVADYQNFICLQLAGCPDIFICPCIVNSISSYAASICTGLSDSMSAQSLTYYNCVLALVNNCELSIYAMADGCIQEERASPLSDASSLLKMLTVHRYTDLGSKLATVEYSGIRYMERRMSIVCPLS